MERGVNMPRDMHHVWYPRRDHKTPTDKRLRYHGNFGVIGPQPWHRELHANVMTPPKLPHNVAHYLIEHIDGLHLPVGSTHGIDAAVEFFRELRDCEKPEMSDLAHVAFEALSQQVYYLKGHHQENAA